MYLDALFFHSQPPSTLLIATLDLSEGGILINTHFYVAIIRMFFVKSVSDGYFRSDKRLSRKA